MKCGECINVPLRGPLKMWVNISCTIFLSIVNIVISSSKHTHTLGRLARGGFSCTFQSSVFRAVSEAQDLYTNWIMVHNFLLKDTIHK